MLLLSCLYKAQQREYWLKDLQTGNQTKVSDSVAATKFLDSLAQNSYYFTQVKEVRQSGQRIEIIFDKGRNYNEAYVMPDETLRRDFQLLPEFFTKNIDSLKNTFHTKYRERGFAFNRIRSKYIGHQNGIPKVEITAVTGEQRKITGFEIRGYEKVPRRFIRNLEKEFTGRMYQEQNLLQIQQFLQNHPFISLEKPPHTLFTKDSTQIFLFLQKRKSNSFDGIIGFGNDKDKKFSFNGSLNVNFRNMFNGFETIHVFWQRNPNKGQTFDLSTDVPYLFKSNIGLNVNVNIYRQDSTFANVKFLPGVYLHVGNRQKLGLRATLETSAVLDSLYTQGRDYNKKGIGMWYSYTEPTEVELFLHKTKIHAEVDFITTKYADTAHNTTQRRLFFSGERNFHVSGNHYLNLRGETALMDTKGTLANNELLRFGGWDSFRGFNEDALLSDFYYFGTAEYRYLVGEQAFFDVFGQYGQLNNKSLSLKPRLYSIGLGFNFYLPIGLMSFQISNGNEFGNPIKFSDTKIHWGILSRF
ncbi:hypothetical protein CO230_10040 [Chryseobacterium sp. 6424]|uniref:hypothetical protein n=1 Tax=Chryseobacterium sp. 6424 TaxID=2039166 RepID=UPI000EFCA625|nr:hypothetical protein [Chryseobacterium sp. 6424]AYO58426.1 hypothetical protein CO230_10040 [Chryseobacterium sp. 6424]